MTSTLLFVVSYEVLGLLTIFVGSCWGHAMFKCCQYAIDDSKVCASLPSISIKEALFFLQKTITWTKKSGKGRQEWHKTCELTMVPPRKIKILVKTCFASRVVLFQNIF
jgi:hypothetical protein